jgi:hypothetical protein
MKNSENINITGLWKFTIEDIKTGKKRIIEKKNLLPTVGRVAMAKQMAGTNTTVMGDNLFIAIGDDNTAATVGDTTLGNETTRKAASSTTNSTTTGIITTFFAAGEATGSHKEFGLFGDGDTSVALAAADSGIIYSHVIQAVTVSATETLTLEFTISFDV